MTTAGERQILKTHLATIARLDEHLNEMGEELVALMPLTVERMAAPVRRQDTYVLAFLKLYEQFADALHQSLRTIVLLMSLGRTERLTPRDVANKAVALGILVDGKAWAEAVRTRNALAQEYPLDPGRQAGQVNRAWDTRATLGETRAAVARFVTDEGLLDDGL